MAAITWSQTFTTGQIPTATVMEGTKDDITGQVNGNLDSANLAAGGVANSRLAAPNHRFSVLVKPCNSADALGGAAWATAVPGVDDNQTGVVTRFQVPVSCTITGISTFCRAANAGGGTRANSARLFLNGAGVDSVVALTAATVVNSGAFTQAVLTTDTLDIRVATDSAATDGVTDPHVWVHCIAAHQA